MAPGPRASAQFDGAAEQRHGSRFENRGESGAEVRGRGPACRGFSVHLSGGIVGPCRTCGRAGTTVGWPSRGGLRYGTVLDLVVDEGDELTDDFATNGWKARGSVAVSGPLTRSASLMRALVGGVALLAAACSGVSSRDRADCESIRFVDSDGSAVAGAVVRVYHGNELVAGPFGPEDDGVVAVPVLAPPALGLRVVCSAPARGLVSGSLQNLIGTTVVMHPCDGMNVLVVDRATGEPLPGVELVLSALPGVANLTDASGRCILPGVQGTVGVPVRAVWHETHAAQLSEAQRAAPGRGEVGWVVPMDSSPPTRVELRLPAEVRPDLVTLRVWGLEKTVPVVSESGRSWVEIPPAAQSTACEWFVEGCRPVLVEEGQEVETLEFERVLPRTGRVLGPGGAVSGACVWASDEEYPEVAFTDGDGRFVLVHSGAQAATIAAPGLVLTDVQLALPKSEHLQIVRLARSAKLRIVLLDPQQTAIPGGVCVYRRTKDGWRKCLARDAGNARVICADGLVPGDYLVTWWMGAGIEREVRIARPGETVEVRLSPPESLR